jgi:hypothetical protein
VDDTRTELLAAALANPKGDRTMQMAALELLATLAEREQLPRARDAFRKYAGSLSITHSREHD